MFAAQPKAVFTIPHFDGFSTGLIQIPARFLRPMHRAPSRPEVPAVGRRPYIDWEGVDNDVRKDTILQVASLVDPSACHTAVAGWMAMTSW